MSTVERVQDSEVATRASRERTERWVVLSQQLLHQCFIDSPQLAQYLQRRQRLYLLFAAFMSLAETSEARKARLIALRKRKAGEAVADEYVLSPL